MWQGKQQWQSCSSAQPLSFLNKLKTGMKAAKISQVLISTANISRPWEIRVVRGNGRIKIKISLWESENWKGPWTTGGWLKQAGLFWALGWEISTGHLSFSSEIPTALPVWAPSSWSLLAFPQRFFQVASLCKALPQPKACTMHISWAYCHAAVWHGPLSLLSDGYLTSHCALFTVRT